jgi:hypothetical protein
MSCNTQMEKQVQTVLMYPKCIHNVLEMHLFRVHWDALHPFALI